MAVRARTWSFPWADAIDKTDVDEAFCYCDVDVVTKLVRGGDVWLAEICAHCGEPIEQKPTGRPRRYCSTRCRTASHRYGDPCPRGRVRRPGATARAWCEHPPPPPPWYRR